MKNTNKLYSTLVVAALCCSTTVGFAATDSGASSSASSSSTTQNNDKETSSEQAKGNVEQAEKIAGAVGGGVVVTGATAAGAIKANENTLAADLARKEAAAAEQEAAEQKIENQPGAWEALGEQSISSTEMNVKIGKAITDGENYEIGNRARKILRGDDDPVDPNLPDTLYRGGRSSVQTIELGKGKEFAGESGTPTVEVDGRIWKYNSEATPGEAAPLEDINPITFGGLKDAADSAGAEATSTPERSVEWGGKTVTEYDPDEPVLDDM